MQSYRIFGTYKLTSPMIVTSCLVNEKDPDVKKINIKLII